MDHRPVNHRFSAGLAHCARIFPSALAKSEVMRLQMKKCRKKFLFLLSKCPELCHPSSLEIKLMILYFGVASLLWLFLCTGATLWLAKYLPGFVRGGVQSSLSCVVKAVGTTFATEVSYLGMGCSDPFSIS